MQHISPEVIAMFEAGATAKHVTEKFRMRPGEAMAMKMEWLRQKQAKQPKAEKAPKGKKAKAEKDD